MTLLLLYWEFFKTGLFAVGGGLATLPFLYEMGPRTGWFTAQDVADMLAVSESTPGPIGVNMAVYTGYTTAGVCGSVCALLGLVTPSIVIIVAIAAFLKAFRQNKYVNGAFYGIRPASTALIAAAGVTVALGALTRPDRFSGLARFWEAVNWPAVVLCAAVVAASRKWPKLHPAVFIGLCAVVGAVLRFGGA